MPNHSDARNARNKTTLSLSLAILIIIMDMSGLAGLAAQEELEEVQEKRETLSGINMPGFQSGLVNSSKTLDISDGSVGSNLAACMVLDDQSLWCWGGSKLNGRTDGSDSSQPQLVCRDSTCSGTPWINQTVSISLGYDHACELLANGTVQCWGEAYAAGDTQSGWHQRFPLPVNLSLSAVHVESGEKHSCAILSNGSIQCWGYNYYGQLGLGGRCGVSTQTDMASCQSSIGAYILTPDYVLLPPGRTAIGLNLYGQISCAILDDYSYICWGEISNSDPYRYVSTPMYLNSSANFRVAIADDSTLVNQDNELRSVYYQSSSWANLQSQFYAFPIYSRNANNISNYDGEVKSNFRSISGGFEPGGQDICAILLNNSVACYGPSAYNNGDYQGILGRAWIEIPSGMNPAAVVQKRDSTISCLALDNGSVLCWGNNGAIGHIGDGTQCPNTFPAPEGCGSGESQNGLEMGYVTSLRYVSMPAGRHLALGEMDHDGDGISTIFDKCPNSSIIWTSNNITDNDSDGCRDSDEDDDDDNDGYSDSDDSYPYDARFHQTLTMDDGWIVGGAYENVSVGCWENCINPGYFIREGGSISVTTEETFRSLSIPYNNWIITSDNELTNINGYIGSSGITTYENISWPNSEGVSAYAVGSDAICAILSSGQLWCARDNVTNFQTDTNTVLERVTFPFPDNYGVSQIARGGSYNNDFCAVLTNRAVYCSEKGVSDQNMSNDWFKINLPIGKEALSVHITQQILSFDHRNTCIVFTDGNASCWGFNNYGQLGNGNTSGIPYYDGLYPVYLPTGISSTIETMAVTKDSTCALFGNGSVYCWGSNQQGQLGDGTVCTGGDYTNNCNGNGAKPIIYDPVIFPTDVSAIALWPTDSNSDEGYCSLMTNQGVWCWGNTNGNSDMNGGLNDGNGYYIDLDGEFVRPGNRDWDSDGIWNTLDNCAGGAQGWTSNASTDVDNDGCIDATEDLDDDGDSYSDSIEISCGTDPLDASDIPLDNDLDGICDAFDVDDDNDGHLDIEDDFPFDENGFIQYTLGDGFQSGQPEDNATLGMAKTTSCSILDDNSLRCWGDNEYGQVGDGTRGNNRLIPTNVSLPSGKIPISVSTSSQGTSFCSIMDDGSLYCWGNNNDGQLGLGFSCSFGSYISGCNGGNGISSPTMIQLPIGSSATAVSLGLDHSCVIIDNGSVFCWGNNQNGKLGVGNTTNTGDWRYSPHPVLMPTGTSAISITTGDRHSCMIIDNGNTFCWGRNYWGQLGDGTSTDRNIPTQISSTSTYISISAGQYFTCAITSQKTLDCWGENSDGQLGLGAYTNSKFTTPQNTILPVNLEVISISSGYDFACAILETMVVYCWGNDDDNKLNTAYNCEADEQTNGCNAGFRVTPAESELPVGRGAIGIATGKDHMCMILDNGGIYCTGNNDYGQLGNESTDGSGPNYVTLPFGISPASNDRDLDHDGVFNNEDLCMEGDDDWISNSTNDYDGDGCQDSTEDLDDDNDYLSDLQEAIIGTNATNPDTDGDGYLDGLDDYPLDSSEWLDTDNDGIGNNADTDDDNDGWSDLFENMCGTNPLDSSSIPNDFDGDGDCDEVDSDDDNDGTSDSMDAFPFDSSADADTDGDGMPDTMIVPDITQIPVDGLIGYWNFDDSSGNPIDSSGESHVSTAFGNLSYGEEGHANDAIQFDGGNGPTGDYVQIETDDVFNTSHITISAWVKLGYLFLGNGPYDMYSSGLVCRGTDSGPSGVVNEQVWCIDLYPGPGDNGTYLRFYFWQSGQNWTFTEVLTTTSLDLSWNHVVATFDGNISKIYLNGQLEASSTALNSSLLSSYEPVYIATRSGGGNGPNGLLNFLNASIDELRIYNRALNNSEIQLLYEVSYTLIEDHDDDNDGWTDVEESECGTSSLNSNDIPTDTDLDGYCNAIDAFPLDPNEWEDSDGDGIGDNSDIFPEDPTETTDTDGDGIGDNIDPDADNDGWNDSDEDVCLTDWLDSSSVPGDIDSDGICDALETDLDNDGWSNANETACGTDMNDINSVPLDTDGDMICDLMDGDIDGDLVPNDQDVFPLNPLEWYDFDGDGIGDNTDPDDDNDGCMDVSDDLPFDPTECDDTDGDGTGDNVDVDDDGDGVIDTNDPFPLDGAATVDTDGDGLPDFLNGTSSTGLVEDNDDDNDGFNDSDDAFPLDLTEWLDTDGDGQGNNADVNDDGDNCPDVIDAFPLNPAECFDTDGDGIGNNADSDDDNDGWLDGTEMACGTSDPLNASSVPDDFDSDGVCDLMDFDDDNDSYVDASDAFPFDPCANSDTDGDGMPDYLVFNCDTTLVEDLDDDNDGYDDANDTFPLDSNEWSDFDMDGMGDNYDSDDDGDMVPDIIDLFPLNASEWFDNDGDGIGDNSDLDDDNDGTEDIDDDFPLIFGITTDTDGDGLPDNMTVGYNGTLSEDLDDDGDGVLDIYDQFPLDSSEWSDTDLDGIGNNADSDDDGDGWSDSDEYICGSDELDANDVPDDSDGDGICDSEDDEDLTTLTGRAEYYLKSPVTVWMALVGVLAGLIGGITSSSMKGGKEKERLFTELRNYTNAVKDQDDYTYLPSVASQSSLTNQSEDSDMINNLVNRGYSREVAEALIESQK